MSVQVPPVIPFHEFDRVPDLKMGHRVKIVGEFIRLSFIDGYEEGTVNVADTLYEAGGSTFD